MGGKVTYAGAGSLFGLRGVYPGNGPWVLLREDGDHAVGRAQGGKGERE